jgi:hypothetical protein
MRRSRSPNSRNSKPEPLNPKDESHEHRPRRND